MAKFVFASKNPLTFNKSIGSIFQKWQMTGWREICQDVLLLLFDCGFDVPD